LPSRHDFRDVRRYPGQRRGGWTQVAGAAFHINCAAALELDELDLSHIFSIVLSDADVEVMK